MDKIVAFGVVKIHMLFQKNQYIHKNALWARRIIGPYFFEDETTNGVTVDGERCGKMLNYFFFNETNVLKMHAMISVVWSHVSYTPFQTKVLGSVIFLTSRRLDTEVLLFNAIKFFSIRLFEGKV